VKLNEGAVKLHRGSESEKDVSSGVGMETIGTDKAEPIEVIVDVGMVVEKLVVVESTEGTDTSDPSAVTKSLLLITDVRVCMVITPSTEGSWNILGPEGRAPVSNENPGTSGEGKVGAESKDIASTIGSAEIAGASPACCCSISTNGTNTNAVAVTTATGLACATTISCCCSRSRAKKDANRRKRAK